MVLLPLIVAMLGSLGCQRALFVIVNRGLAPPDATVVYAPDRQLALDVYRPRHRQGDGPAPMVVFFHGGNWTSGQRAEYRFVGRRLADNGIVVVIPDYRTYPATKFPGFMDDAADAVAWALAHAADYSGDPRRVFIAGHSAGAQIAALLGTDGEYLARHRIRPKQLAGVIGLSGPYDFDVGETYAPIFGPPSQWPRAMAVNFVDGDEPPFLLIQGDADHTVAARNSVELAARLRAAQVPVTMILLPGAGHLATIAALHEPARTPAELPAILAFIRARPRPQ